MRFGCIFCVEGLRRWLQEGTEKVRRRYGEGMEKSSPGSDKSVIYILSHANRGGLIDRPLGYWTIYNWTSGDAVSFMMEPLLNPGDILSAGDEASSLWSQLVFQMLNDTSQPITSLSSINGPIFYGADGQPHLATAKDVVRSQALQNKLYDAVRDYIDKVVSVPRDMNNIDHPQNVGNSSTKAARYLP